MVHTDLTKTGAIILVILPSLARTVGVHAELRRAVLLHVLAVEPGGVLLALAGIGMLPREVGLLVGLEDLPILRADRPQGGSSGSQLK